MAKHKHHIIPKHMGGSNDPSNLVMLTVEEHAEAHRKLYEEHGHWQDYYAWRGLAGILPKQEIIRLIQVQGAKKRNELYGNPFSGIRTEYNFDENREFQEKCTLLAKTPQAILKKKAKFKQIGHQQGEKNSQFGTCWVTHDEHGNKKIPLGEIDKFLSLGYSRGRKMVVN